MSPEANQVLAMQAHGALFTYLFAARQKLNPDAAAVLDQAAGLLHGLAYLSR